MVAYTDYLFIIAPSVGVIKEIDRYKRASVNMIGHFEGMHSRAHILVSRQNRCKPFFAEPAIVKMQERISTMPPLELEINGFGFASYTRPDITIFARFKNTPHTQNWFKLLTRQMGIKIKNLELQIPIAQNIPPGAFKKLWPKFEQQTLSETFTANSLTVLHRETFVEYCEWRVYRELFFANKLGPMF